MTPRYYPACTAARTMAPRSGLAHGRARSMVTVTPRPAGNGAQARPAAPTTRTQTRPTSAPTRCAHPSTHRAAACCAPRARSGTASRSGSHPSLPLPWQCHHRRPCPQPCRGVCATHDPVAHDSVARDRVAHAPPSRRTFQPSYSQAATGAMNARRPRRGVRCCRRRGCRASSRTTSGVAATLAGGPPLARRGSSPPTATLGL